MILCQFKLPFQSKDNEEEEDNDVSICYVFAGHFMDCVQTLSPDRVITLDFKFMFGVGDWI